MKVICCLSGGLDSTVLLWHMKDIYGIEEIRTISFDYGQRHKKELEAAQKIALLAGVEHRIVDLSSLTPLLGNSSLTNLDIEVPEGHYEEESMRVTVVPNRNMIFLSIATTWAISSNSQYVAIACHAGDHAIYPDCRDSFLTRLNSAISQAHSHRIGLSYPFVYMDKKEIVQTGIYLKAPIELSWSCYKGGTIHCGKCGTCVERKEAFTLAKVNDPTDYEDTTGAYRE